MSTNQTKLGYHQNSGQLTVTGHSPLNMSTNQTQLGYYQNSGMVDNMCH